jgi:hypothetical protein
MVLLASQQQLLPASNQLCYCWSVVLELKLHCPCLCVQVTPHLVVTWRPDLAKYTAHMFTPSDLSDPVNATIYQVDRPESDALLLSQALKDWQNDVHSVNQLLNSAMCQIAVPLSSIDIFWVSTCKSS